MYTSQQHITSLIIVKRAKKVAYRLLVLILYITSLNPKFFCRKNNLNQVQHFVELKKFDIP
jgi:hypothetical protein